MNELAYMAIGVVAGVVIGAAIALQFLADRKDAERVRLANVLRTERIARCVVGQHREVLDTRPPFLVVRCLDCDAREELGAVYPSRYLHAIQRFL